MNGLIQNFIRMVQISMQAGLVIHADAGGRGKGTSDREI